MLVAICLLGALSLVEGGKDGAPTPDTIRWLVISHVYAGMGMAYIMGALQLSQSTVYRICKRFRESGTVDSDRAPRIDDQPAASELTCFRMCCRPEISQAMHTHPERTSATCLTDRGRSNLVPRRVRL